jgi:hypothetical protein
MRASELEIDLGTVTMNCTTDEIAATLAALLHEMRSVLPRLREDERDVLRQIMSRDSGALTVGDVFSSFTRESEGHKTLRRLRAAQFVRPAMTGRWALDEPIEVKAFARLMWDHVGEDAIFAGAPAIPTAAPVEEVVDLGEVEVAAKAEEAAVEVASKAEEAAVEEQPADDVVDLMGVEDEKAEKPSDAKKRESGFEDDNLDLGDYDDLCAYAEEEIRGKR